MIDNIVSLIQGVKNGSPTKFLLENLEPLGKIDELSKLISDESRGDPADNEIWYDIIVETPIGK